MSAAADESRTSMFEGLLAPVLEPAYRAAYHLARNSADAEDIVQEASLLAWRSFDSFEQGTNFKAWFQRIVMNVFLTRCRAERRRGTSVPLAADDGDSGDRTVADAHWAAEGGDAAEAVLGSMDLEAVQTALASLPVEYRTVAVLYFVDDLSYEQIAEAIGSPVGTVRSRLHRGRRLLWKRLSATARDLGLRAAI
jgi:RNA polymerase sigma-70 factor (ECF subfamily)